MNARSRPPPRRSRGRAPPGTHYVDLANELPAVEGVLALDRRAAAAQQVFVTGAGFGVLAPESVLLRVCDGQPRPTRVRVDALASVAAAPGVLSPAEERRLPNRSEPHGREPNGHVRPGSAERDVAMLTPR